MIEIKEKLLLPAPDIKPNEKLSNKLKTLCYNIQIIG